MAPDTFASDTITVSDDNTLNDGTGVANMQEHLDATHQKSQLASVLNEFNTMFNCGVVLGACSPSLLHLLLHL